MRNDFDPLSDKIIPISLREDVQVQIYGLPWDLTKAEAAKIARVITAFTVSDTAERLGKPRETLMNSSSSVQNNPPRGLALRGEG